MSPRARTPLEHSTDLPPERLARARRVAHKLAGLGYGLTAEAVEALTHAQFDDPCHICGVRPEGLLCIDHDHETGFVRGLLCNPCNTALGSFKDDPATLLAAIQYLARAGATLELGREVGLVA